MFESHIPISIHFTLSKPSEPSNKKVIIPILYIWPEIVSQSFTSRSTHPVRLMCYKQLIDFINKNYVILR